MCIMESGTLPPAARWVLRVEALVGTEMEHQELRIGDYATAAEAGAAIPPNTDTFYLGSVTIRRSRTGIA